MSEPGERGIPRIAQAKRPGESLAFFFDLLGDLEDLRAIVQVLSANPGGSVQFG